MQKPNLDTQRAKPLCNAYRKGHVAQRESTVFTRRGSLVQSQPRPPVFKYKNKILGRALVLDDLSIEVPGCVTEDWHDDGEADEEGQGADQQRAGDDEAP